MKQKSVSGASTHKAPVESKSKSSLFEREPERPSSKFSDRPASSANRSEYSSSHKSTQSSSASSRYDNRDRSTAPGSSDWSRGVSSSTSATDRYVSSHREEPGRSSHYSDRRRSPSNHHASRHSRSPSPRRNYGRDASDRRDSRSPPRRPSEPMRFGRVEKIRPEETQSYQMKRPYDNRYDVCFCVWRDE